MDGQTGKLAEPPRKAPSMQLSRRGLVGAAALGAAALAQATAQPVAAAPGQAVIIGAANSAANTTTSLTTGTGIGFWGLSSSSVGLYGYSGSLYGVYGYSATGTGVFGTSGTNGFAGVYGYSGGSNYGVYGFSSSSLGAYCSSGSSIGLYGYSGSYIGVFGTCGTNGFTGVYGSGGSSNYGVYGFSGSTFGVYGYSTSSVGVYGTCGTNGFSGLYGYGGPRFGVYGFSTSSIGVYGYSGSYIAVFGYAGSTSGWAGYFVGDVAVTDDLVVGGTIFGVGSVGAAVQQADGSYQMLYAVGHRDRLSEDFGEAALEGGHAAVQLNPAFSALVEGDSYHVLLTPYGDSNGLYVTNRTAAGFEVREQKGGASNLSFSYRVVGKLKQSQEANTALAMTKAATTRAKATRDAVETARRATEAERRRTHGGPEDSKAPVTPVEPKLLDTAAPAAR